MPNWAYADNVVEGDEKQIDTLYLIMKELEKTDKNEEGKVWLGHLIKNLGGDTKKIDSRAWWYDLCLYDGKLSFTLECAWSEKMEARHFIERQFPGIKIWYECTADDFWVTNVEGGLYNQYVLYTEAHGENFYQTLEELIVEVENVTGEMELRTLLDCEKALQRHYEDDSDYYIGQFEIID